MRVLLAVLLLSVLLLAYKIVGYDISDRTGSADLLLVFDEPYKGAIRKSRQNNKITIKLDGALIDASKAEKITSPYLTRLSIQSSGKETKIIAEVPASVTMAASKTSDSRRLRLRFSEVASQAAVPATKTTASAPKKPAPAVKAAAPEAGAPENMRQIFTVVAVGGIIALLLLLLWLKRKKRKAEELQVEPSPPKAEGEKANEMFTRLKTLFKPRQESEKTQEDVLPKAKAKSAEKEKSDAMPNRFEKLLNPKSKLLMLVAGVTVILLLLPKINLYYQFERLIEPYGVILNNEQLDDRGLWLNIKNSTLYFKEIESAHTENIDVMLFGLYNRVDIKNIRLADTFKQFVPGDIERIEATYSVMDPMHIRASAVGEFGTAEAKVAVRDRNISVTLQPSELMKTRYRSMLNKLEKDETGGYHYVSRF